MQLFEPLYKESMNISKWTRCFAIAVFIKDYKCVHLYGAFSKAKGNYLLAFMEVLCKERQREKGEGFGPVN